MGIELFGWYFKDVVEDLPDAIGFAAQRVRVHFCEEEERGVILLICAAVPNVGLQGWICF